MSIRFGSLFAGIGGFDLGLERSGMECIWQVEIDPFCQKVLAKHWPDVRRFSDVGDVGAHNLEAVDLICGGFPCQDVSLAGNRAGLNGKRSTLWSEFYRIVCEIRPRWVVIENVPGLLSSDNGGFFSKILRELSSGGYDAEWRIISGSDVGAPHRRERLWIVAYPNGSVGVDGILRERRPSFSKERKKSFWCNDWSEFTLVSRPVAILQEWSGATMGQSPLVRMDDGIPDIMDRLHATGNAIVPQVAELIGRAITQAEQLSLLEAS
jgi:DNA (cytosine-5)-methyltransferase 1